MKLFSAWRFIFSFKIRMSTLVLCVVPCLIIAGWLGIWMPTSLRTLMLALFDHLGELIYYPLGALALALGFFFAALFKKQVHAQYLLESGIALWILLNWPIY